MPENNQAQTPETQEDLNEVLKVRREKLSQLCENGENPFLITKFNRTHQTKEILENFEALEGQTVTVAGRLLSKRGMGKASVFRPLRQGRKNSALC